MCNFWISCIGPKYGQLINFITNNNKKPAFGWNCNADLVTNDPWLTRRWISSVKPLKINN